MLNLWIWMIEKLNLFKDFSKEGINQSFALPIMLTLIIIFVIVVILTCCLLKDDFNLIHLIVSAMVASFITAILCSNSLPADPTTLIKTDLVKETTTTLIPSEGVTETSLVLKETGEKVQPSTLKEGDELTLIVKVEENSFKKDFQYKKENLKITKTKSEKDEISAAYIRKREFRDTVFNKTKIREENDVVLEMNTIDPFFVNE